MSSKIRWNRGLKNIVLDFFICLKLARTELLRVREAEQVMLWDVACGRGSCITRGGWNGVFMVHSIIAWFYRSLCLLQTPATKHSWLCLDCFIMQKVSPKHLLLYWHVRPTSTSLQGPKSCWCENLWVFPAGSSQRRAGAVCDTWGNKPCWRCALHLGVQGMFSCAETQESDWPARLGICAGISAWEEGVSPSHASLHSEDWSDIWEVPRLHRMPWSGSISPQSISAILGTLPASPGMV